LLLDLKKKEKLTGMPTTKDFVSKLRLAAESYLSAHQSTAKETALIYLFGSYAMDNVGPRSDIDLAFLFHENMYRRDPFETAGSAHMLAAHLADLYNVETDAVVLNSASIEIAYRVVTTGICVYESDVDQRFEYEAKVRGLYYDFKPFLVELRTGQIQALQRGEEH